MIDSDTKSAQPGEPPFQTGALNGSGILMIGTLVIQSNEEPHKSIEVALSGTEGFILGRSDGKSKYTADIDLSLFDALDKGVSRRHAALVYYENKLHLVDLSSVNGSHLNGQRLMSETPYLLNDGDHMTLGQLALVISHREK